MEKDKEVRLLASMQWRYVGLLRIKYAKEENWKGVADMFRRVDAILGQLPEGSKVVNKIELDSHTRV
ncbi:hypothetical protein [Pseudomonas phage LUZ7]|uniref:Uncharacterized protein n=1 Tax=Pseudomonas phage LUZ7 TaxID=655097 RepID=C8ZKC3_9CAUD|nr:hypothetical protein PP-LUZ7_gp024 [Pseudomonas phage LUZ7]CAZ66165.1 hypothetical protein [Pseudomonas phage LUZ7]